MNIASPFSPAAPPPRSPGGGGTKRTRAAAAVQAAFVAAWMLLLCASLGLKASARLLGWPRWGEFVLGENRELASFPDFRRTPVRSWGAALDAWYNDQFAFRSRIVQFYRFVHADLLYSPIVANEIPGLGGWMFRNGMLRNGNDWPEINDYLGVFELTPAETARWIELFEGRREWAAAHGLRYLQAITPTKAQIHPEHLPPAIAHHRGRCVRDQVRAALESSPARDSVIFLCDALRDATDREHRLCFYQVDHHVNAYGCYILWREIMAAAGRLLGTPMEMPPYGDDPPPAVRGNLEWGCFPSGSPGYERLAVRMPGMECVSSRAFDPGAAANPAARRHAFFLAFAMPGGARRTLVVAHDSFLRYGLTSWLRHDVEPVRIPLASGFDRALTLMFTRYDTRLLARIVAAESPALVVEQISEMRLAQDVVGLDETMHRAAAFSRGTPVSPEDAAALPPGTPLLARATLRDAVDPTGTWTDMGEETDVPELSVEILAGGTALASAATWPGPCRAVYYPPLPLGGHPASLRVSGGSASSAVLDLRLPAP